jgi:predicted MFS family arabinose efflux permease
VTTGLGPLAILYVTQYLGIGFITVGLSAILRDGGTSLDTLAVLQFVGLIWPIKFLWAPLLDRYGSRRHGHHRSWLFVLQAAMVVALLALLPFADPSSRLGPIIAVCAAYVFLSATQDIAVDAVAVRVLSDRQRGTGNGIQISAGYLGNLIGGGLCVIVYDRFGWVAAVTLLAALTAVGLLTIWSFREDERAERVAGTSQAYRALLSVFAQPGCRRWTFGVVPLLYVGSGAAYALVTPALVDAGWSLGRIGVVTGIVTSVPAIAAGLAAGAVTSRIGRSGVLITGGASIAVSTLLLLPLMNGSAPATLTIVALCCFMAAYTVVNVVVYTVNMDYSRAATGGTDFTVLSSFGLICSFVAASIGLFAAGWFGYPAVAIAAAVLVLLGVALGLGHQRQYRRPAEPVEAMEPATV